MPDDVRILVTTTTRASPDGLRVFTYDAGQSYGAESNPPMPAALAETFLREGWGEACGEDGQASRVRVHEDWSDNLNKSEERFRSPTGSHS